MIKAIIFDCFGVLTSDGWLPFKDKYFGDNPENYKEATKLNALANANKISYAQFLTQVSELAGVPKEELNIQMHKSVANTQIFPYIEELKENYKIGLLSNISGDWLQELFTVDQLQLFDETALSYETGYAKPDHRAYQAISDKLGCQTDECVFIDDQMRLAEGAKSAGMKSIVFKSVVQLRKELGQLLNMSDANK